MDITLTTTTLTATVQRSLSIIGKRSVDDKGNLLFKDITLGSLEEPILADFFSAAVTAIVADLRHFASFTATNTGWALVLTMPTNFPTSLQNAVTQAVTNYMVAYALYSWFIVTAPRIADKYRIEANDNKAYVLQLAYQKKPPTAPTADSSDIDPLAVTTEVTTNTAVTTTPNT